MIFKAVYKFFSELMQDADQALAKNKTDLAWNAAAMIPGAGQGATAMKFANRGYDARSKK